MKTIRINFTLTPERQKKIFKIIIAILFASALFYGMLRIYGYTKEKMTSGNNKFLDCNVNFLNQTLILNDTLNLYLDCNTSFAYVNKSYNSCSDMLASKNGNITEMETDMTSYRIDLKNCEVTRDTYETKYNKCRKDLSDCEDSDV